MTPNTTHPIAPDQKGHAGHAKAGLAGLVVGAIGVVFGDIGTSPLYTIKEAFLPHYGLDARDPAEVLGLLSLAFLPFLARLLTRFGPGTVIPWTAVVSALITLGEWVLSAERPRLAAAALFVHTMVLGPALVSGFWSLFNERFDPHTAKQIMGRIAGGAALGGVVGGVIVELAGDAGVALTSLLPMLAGLQLLAAGGCRAIFSDSSTSGL